MAIRSRLLASPFLAAVLLAGCFWYPSEPADLLNMATDRAAEHPQKAAKLLHRSAAMGHWPAMLTLGEYYAGNRRFTVFARAPADSIDADKSLYWFRQALAVLESSQDGDELMTAATFYNSGLGGVAADTSKAATMALAAAAAGTSAAEFMAAGWNRDNQPAVVQTIQNLRASDEAAALRLESALNYYVGSRSVVAWAQPLADAIALGDPVAKERSLRAFYSIRESADAGEAAADSSRAELQKAGLWVEPPADYLPHAGGS